MKKRTKVVWVDRWVVWFCNRHVYIWQDQVRRSKIRPGVFLLRHGGYGPYVLRAFDLEDDEVELALDRAEAIRVALAML
ncbi:MAG: hypothetical protein AB7G12_12635 [Thermoanaerobaculia bacterium]